MRRLVLNLSSPVHPISESMRGYRERYGGRTDRGGEGQTEILVSNIVYNCFTLEWLAYFQTNKSSLVLSKWSMRAKYSEPWELAGETPFCCCVCNDIQLSSIRLIPMEILLNIWVYLLKFQNVAGMKKIFWVYIFFFLIFFLIFFSTFQHTLYTYIYF